MGQTTEDIEAKLAAFVDGELDAAGCEEIERHLVANPQHRKLLEELVLGRGLLRDLPREKAPPEILDAIQSQLERRLLLDAGTEEAVGGSGPGVLHRFAAVAAVLLLSATLGLVIWSVLPTAPPVTGEVAMVEAPGSAPQVGADGPVAGAPVVAPPGPVAAAGDAGRRVADAAPAGGSLAGGGEVGTADVVAATAAALDGLRLGAGPSDGHGTILPGMTDAGVASVPPAAEPRLDATEVPRLAARERAEGAIAGSEAVPSVVVLEADDLAAVEREIAGVLTSNQVQFEQVAAAQVQMTPVPGAGLSAAPEPGASRDMAMARESMSERAATGTNLPGVAADTPFRGLPADGATAPGAEAGPLAQVASNESVYVARKLSRVQVQAINDALAESAGRQRFVKKTAVAPEAKVQYQNLAQRPGLVGQYPTEAQKVQDPPAAEHPPSGGTAPGTGGVPTPDAEAQDVVIVVRGRGGNAEPVQPAPDSGVSSPVRRSASAVPGETGAPAPATAPAEPTTAPATQPN